MVNFRKTSIPFRQQVYMMFQNEKKMRKNGMTECADFEFRQIDYKPKSPTDLRYENMKRPGFYFNLCYPRYY